MFRELLQILQEFERQDSANRITWIEATLAAQNGSAPSAFENYKRAKEEWQDEQSRRQRFYDFLMQRRDLVDAVAKSVIDSSTKEITAKAEQELSKAFCEKLDKTVKYYFK